MDREISSHQDLVDFTYRVNANCWTVNELYGLSSSFAISFNMVRAGGRLLLVVIDKLKRRTNNESLADIPTPRPPGEFLAQVSLLRELCVEDTAITPPLTEADPLVAQLPLGFGILQTNPELNELEQSSEPALINGFRALREMMLLTAVAAVENLLKDQKRLMRHFVREGRLTQSDMIAWKSDQNKLDPETSRRYAIARIIRNVISHHGGRFDQEAVQSMLTLGVEWPIAGQIPPLSAMEAKSLIEACVNFGLERLSRTDLFLSKDDLLLSAHSTTNSGK